MHSLVWPSFVGWTVADLAILILQLTELGTERTVNKVGMSNTTW